MARYGAKLPIILLVFLSLSQDYISARYAKPEERSLDDILSERRVLSDNRYEARQQRSGPVRSGQQVGSVTVERKSDVSPIINNVRKSAVASPYVKKSYAMPPTRDQKSYAMPPTRDQKSYAMPPKRDQKSYAMPPTRDQKSYAMPPTRGKKSYAMPPTRDQKSYAMPPTRDQKSYAMPPTRGKKSYAMPPSRGKKSYAMPPTRDQKSYAMPPTRGKKSYAMPPTRVKKTQVKTNEVEQCPASRCVDPVSDENGLCDICPYGTNCLLTPDSGSLVSGSGTMMLDVGGGCLANCVCPGSSVYAEHGPNTRADCSMHCPWGFFTAEEVALIWPEGLLLN